MKKLVISDVENSANVQVQKANQLAQFFQTLSMLSLTLVVCGFLLLDDRLRLTLWTLVCFAVALASFLLAIRHGLKAVRIYHFAKFELSRRRLATLLATNLPRDVLKTMLLFRRGKYTGEDRFFRKLANAVGTERCAEVRNQIFKYTKVN